MANEYITVAQVRERLGNISKAKMAKLIANGYFTTYPNPLDERSKLIRVVDVEAFLKNGAVARQSKRRAPSHATRRRGAGAGDSNCTNY